MGMRYNSWKRWYYHSAMPSKFGKILSRVSRLADEIIEIV